MIIPIDKNNKPEKEVKHYNLISMSLYGTAKRYLDGAIWNVNNYKKYFPDWKLRIYCASDVPIVNFLKRRDCEVIVKKINLSHGPSFPMFWRLLATEDKLAEHIIIRDIDSKVNEKDAAATQEWISSGLDAHIMKDHLCHFNIPILGGLWGVKGELLTGMLKLIKEWTKGKHINYGDDERFLAEQIWPLIKDSCLEHSSRANPFPIKNSQITPHLCCTKDFAN